MRNTAAASYRVGGQAEDTDHSPIFESTKRAQERSIIRSEEGVDTQTNNSGRKSDDRREYTSATDVDRRSEASKTTTITPKTKSCAAEETKRSCEGRGDDG